MRPTSRLRSSSAIRSLRFKRARAFAFVAAQFIATVFLTSAFSLSPVYCLFRLSSTHVAQIASRPFGAER